MNKLLLLIFSLIVMASTCTKEKPFEPTFLEQKTGLSASARGVYAVDEKVVWIVNSKGAYARTIDGGKTWQSDLIAGIDSLDFRDVFAVDGQMALAMSAGTGASSRIYRTTDGGKSWALQFQNTEPKAFFDAFAFWDARHGILISDPIGNKPYLLLTTDGGTTWTAIDSTQLPAIRKGEYGFAASGTCIAVEGDQNVWLATGGSAARVFFSSDRGASWTVFDTPMTSGADAKGIFSIAFADAKNGVIVGGDYSKPELAQKNVAFSADGGHSWVLAEQADSVGYQSCVQFLGEKKYLATGTNGSNYSIDGGKSWQKVSEMGFNAIALSPNRKVAWLVGSKGKVAKIEF